MMRPVPMLLCVVLVSALTAYGKAAGAPKPVYIGLDAEFGRPTGTADDAIKQGIKIAVEEINASGGVLGGRKLALLEKDNRSVPARGKQNTREFGENQDVVAMFCGRFSTVVIETIETVHQYGIPLLDPWAASDKIVDNGFSPNYVFRLSLRDSWAVQTLLDTAVKRGFKKIGVMTGNVSWGRGNNELVTGHAPERGLEIVSNQSFNYGDRTFLNQYRKIKRAGAQAVIVVISELEGAVFVKEVASMRAKERLPILCHWSVTGSDFPALTGPALFDLDFSVVQTFSFMDAKRERAAKVLDAARRLFNKKSPGDIVSPVGLAHAYDLTHILARAIDLAGSTDRKAVRDALERVTEYDGLIKHYPQPFSASWHEALGPGDVFIARYRKDGTIIRSE